MIKVEKRRIYWFFIYPLATVAFVLMSVLFIMSAKGYNISFENGRIEFKETGMFIISSKPTGASVFLNGRDLSKKTNGFFSTKITRLRAKEYSLSVKKDGYYEWKKDLSIFPEMVTWADYVLLFSKNPKTEEVKLDGGLSQDFSSLDKKRSIILTESPVGAFVYQLDNSSGEVASILETSKLSQDKKISGISILDWSKDYKNVLLLASREGSVEKKYWVLNTASKDIEELSALAAADSGKVFFNTENSDEVYGSFGGEIKKINIVSKNISDVLESQVIQFVHSLDGKIYYIKNTGKTRALYSINSDFLNGKTNILDSLPISDTYEIKISDEGQKISLKTNEDGGLYMVAKVGGKNSLVTMGKNISNFSWSPKGNRLAYKAESGLVVFEDEEYRKESKEYTFADSDRFEGIKWYDNYHILTKANGKVAIMDFDGTNKVFLGESPGSAIFYNPDNGDIYFFSSIKDKASILKYKTDF